MKSLHTAFSFAPPSILSLTILMSLLYHNDTIIKKEKELLRALLIQFCKLEAETGGLVLYQNHENHLRMEIAKKAGTESFSCCNVYQRNRNESSRSFTAGRDGTTAENTPAMP